MTTPEHQVRVRALTHEAEGILGLELVPLPGQALPPFTAGAHIDLHLAGANSSQWVRSYSLINDPAQARVYRIGVNRDAASRGGSRHVHESIRPGQLLTISAPRNNFPLDESAAHNVFIAGGIGITPMLSMIARSQALGTPWTLYYAARTREHAGFLDVIAAYQNQSGAQVHLNFDKEPGGRMLDLAAVVAAQPETAHLYCCGPLPMLEAYEKATAALPQQRVHKEYFASKAPAATDGSYTVELARTKKTLQVKPGQSLLDCLLEARLDLPWSCREGICGTCEVRVLAGQPDHRDLVLTDAEKARSDRMMICCSGALSERLVLDI